MQEYIERLLDEFIKETHTQVGKKVIIWGCNETGLVLFEKLKRADDIDSVSLVDTYLGGKEIDYMGRSYKAYTPDDIINVDDAFFLITPKIRYPEVEALLKEKGKTKFVSFYSWLEDKRNNDIEYIKQENRELLNLTATLLEIQRYKSDLIVDGVYRNTAPITTIIGCPVTCKYCPQKTFVRAYMNRPNPIKVLDFDTFKMMLSKMPIDVIVSFTGMVEPFANPKALDMILYAMDKGHKVRVYSTMYNQNIDSYKAFKDHPNLKTFDLHIPDSQGNTCFPITDQYLELLEYITHNKPKYGGLWTSCLGVDGATNDKIRHLINVPGNAINSVHGLLYNNHIHHGRAKLSCKFDCSRLDNPKAGVGMVFPNGDVTGCTQDWELKHIIGNILEVDSWEDLMNSEARKTFIRGLEDYELNTICRTCELAVKVGESDIN